MSLKFIRVLMLTVCLSAAGFSVTACNTMEGFGKDTRAAGEAISDAARNSR